MSRCTCYSDHRDNGRMVKTFTRRNPKCPTQAHRNEADQ
jgi:hypothetical protein